MDFWYVFGIAANILTVIAALIAIVGVISLWLSRPRMNLQANHQGSDILFVTVSNTKGSSPVLYLAWEWGGMTANGDVLRGDGDPWQAALYPKEARSLTLYQHDMELAWKIDPPDISRPVLASNEGVMVDITWQRTMVPWRRERGVVLWSAEDREAGVAPSILRGRAADRAYNKAHELERKLTAAQAKVSRG